MIKIKNPKIIVAILSHFFISCGIGKKRQQRRLRPPSTGIVEN